MLNENVLPIINGKRIVVVPPTKVQVNRGWKERLFTCPWRPLQKTKTVLQQMLKPGEIIVTADVIYVTEEVAVKIRSVKRWS